jgi:hypothetical protein
MKRNLMGPIVAIAAIAVLLISVGIGLVQGATSSVAQRGPSPTSSALSTPLACGQSKIPLGAAGNFEVLAGTTVTNIGATVVKGNLGVSPGSAVTGFPPGKVTGKIDKANTAAADGQLALTKAYDAAKGRSNCPIKVAGNIGGKTLTPGLYKSTSSLSISSGDLTLTGTGVFVFQIASKFTVTSGRTVILAGGAVAGNIYWQVGSSAVLGTTSVVYGNILALKSISLATGATVHGRTLARNGGVTLEGNKVNPVPASLTSSSSLVSSSHMATSALVGELSLRDFRY